MKTPKKQKATEPQRYVIRGDDSGHNYYIRIQDQNEFDDWVSASEDFDNKYTGRDFSEFRIDGTFTFTDPRME